MLYKDTIAAIATPGISSGIGIIRISGSDSIKMIGKIYKSKSGKKDLSTVESHTIHYGFIYDVDEMIDEVMVSIFRAPRSFTTEDTVEINCHGGIFVMNRILELLIKNGVRIALPGEFTKRAFLNGRIDLSKAEAVMDVIQSKNELALKNSISQLNGSVYNQIKRLRDDIIFQIAFIESALDDPEHVSLDGYADKLEKEIDIIIEKINNLLKHSENGKILKEGINTVILGKPNVGKSSLMNLLLGEDRAIVTDIAGTTRDVIEEKIRLHGIELNIMDTAGIRDTDNIVEQIGVEKAKKIAKEADLIIYVVDSSTPLDKNDDDIINIIYDRNVIILLNKSDLSGVITEELLLKKINKPVIPVSVIQNIGLNELEDKIQEMFFDGKIEINDDIIITNLRQKEALLHAYDSLKLVKQSIMNQMPEDFYSIDLLSAYSSLGEIIGEEMDEDLVNKIFSEFCMGK